MATVHYEPGCHDSFDDDDRDPADRAPGSREVPDAPEPTLRRGRPVRGFHRIAEVRRQQGVTLRNVARRLGIEMGVVRRQEHPEADLRISDLLLWQQVLEVPVAELLVEGEGQLSGPVLERSRILKLMKTAAAIRERTGGTPVGRLVDMLISQILEIMPELRDVTPWHTVGQRRTLDDVGRAAAWPVSEEIFRRQP